MNASCGASRANVAIRWSDVDTVVGLGVPAIFPSNGSKVLDSPSLHRVAWGGFPDFTGSMEVSDTSSPSQTSSVALDVRYLREMLASLQRQEHPTRRGLGPWSSVGLPGHVHRRQEALPGSWETHIHTCPALRPRWAGFSLPYREKPVLPSSLRKPSAPRDVTFEAPSRGLHVRCLRFTVWVAPARRKTRFQPAG